MAAFGLPKLVRILSANLTLGIYFYKMVTVGRSYSLLSRKVDVYKCCNFETIVLTLILCFA